MTDTRTIEECATARLDIESLPGVISVSVSQDDPRLDRNVLEITVAPGYDRVPPRVLRTLARHDFGIRDVTPRGEPAHLHIVAC